MRGIVSLAAALALPATLPNGEAFPARDLIILITFFVIAAPLVGQGLTLAPLKCLWGRTRFKALSSLTPYVR